MRSSREFHVGTEKLHSGFAILIEILAHYALGSAFPTIRYQLIALHTDIQIHTHPYVYYVKRIYRIGQVVQCVIKFVVYIPGKSSFMILA